MTHYESYKPEGFQDRSFFIPNVHPNFGDVIEDAMKVLRNDEIEFWPLDLY